MENFVRVSIQGQSFLFNQIRKMIAVAIEVFRGSAPKNAIKYCLNKLHSVNVNTAPAQGLFLHHVCHRLHSPTLTHIIFIEPPRHRQNIFYLKMSKNRLCSL